MKFQYWFLTIVQCSILSTNVSAQAAEEQEGKSKLTVSTLSVQIGAFQIADQYGGAIADFEKLAPNSELLRQDFKDFEKSAYYSRGETADFAFSAYLHLDVNSQRSSWDMLNPQLRLGVSYISSTLLSASYLNSELFRYDTLNSSRNGERYYVDSVSSESYNFNHFRKHVFFDASFIIQSDHENRWQFYGGCGVSVGFSFNAYTNLRYEKSNYFETDGIYSSSYGRYDNNSYHEEESRNKEGFSAMLTLPMGIGYKLSRQNQFWSNCRLFFEVRPSLYYFGLTEVESMVGAGTYTNFGVNYRLN